MASVWRSGHNFRSWTIDGIWILWSNFFYNSKTGSHISRLKEGKKPLCISVRLRNESKVFQACWWGEAEENSTHATSDEPRPPRSNKERPDHFPVSSSALGGLSLGLHFQRLQLSSRHWIKVKFLKTWLPFIDLNLNQYYIWSEHITIYNSIFGQEHLVLNKC